MTGTVFLIEDNLYERVIGVAATRQQADEMVETFLAARHHDHGRFWDNTPLARKGQTRDEHVAEEDACYRQNIYVTEWTIGKVTDY
jgi:hypothetical protein